MRLFLDTASIDDGLHLMRERRVRRLPVLDAGGKMVGIVSDKDLLHAAPSPATSLSVYEKPALARSCYVSVLKRQFSNDLSRNRRMLNWHLSGQSARTTNSDWRCLKNSVAKFRFRFGEREQTICRLSLRCAAA